jgi:hypothetical protein
MDDAVLVIVGLIFVVAIVGSYLLQAFLRRRFTSWILGRVRGSMSWIGRSEPLTGQGLEEKRLDRRGLFDAMEGRSETDAAAPRKRAGAGPKGAGTTIENLNDRDPK